MNKQLVILAFFIVAFTISSGCSSQKSIQNSDKKNKTEEKISTTNGHTKQIKSSEKKKSTETEKEVVKTSSAMAIEFDSLETIKNSSTLGVEGLVIAEESYVHTQEGSPSTPYTKLVLEITKVLSGDTSLVGQTIIIVESGGEITKEELGFKEKFPGMTEEELQEEVIVQSDGLENTRVGEEIIGFLTNDMGDMLTEFPFYSFMGEYQSRFKKNEETDRFERELPEKGFEEGSKSRRSVANGEEIRNNVINDELNQLLEATN